MFVRGAVVVTWFALLLLRCSFARADSVSRDAPVLILGAGVAGAKVALDLHRNGIDNFLVIEANERVGGRLRQVKFGPDNLTVEAGANWMQGYRDENSVSTFADKHIAFKGIATDFDDVYFVEDGVLVDDEVADPVWNRAGKAVDAILQLAQDQSRRPGGPEYDTDVRSALLFTAGWEANSPIEKAAMKFEIDLEYGVPGSAMSVHSLSPLYYPDAAETVDFFVNDKRGFEELVRVMLQRAGIDNVDEPGSKLRLGSPVAAIRYNDSAVSVRLRSGEIIKGSAAVSTFSVGVLQESLMRPREETRVKFRPELPAAKRLAIAKYELTDYHKVYIQFNKPLFTNKDPLFLLPLDCSEGGTFISLHNLNKKGYLPGSNAVLLDSVDAYARETNCQAERETLREALKYVSKAAGLEVTMDDVRAWYIPNWRQDPFFKGSFSVRTTGMTSADFEAFNRPLGALFFAGEAHAPDGLSGYVQGAWSSGRATAEEVLKYLKR